MKVAFLLALLTVIIIFSCNKDGSKLVENRSKEDENRNEEKPYPVANCKDTSDDFRFNSWDSSIWYHKIVLNGIKTATSENINSYDTFYFTGNTITTSGDSVKFKWIQKNRPTTRLLLVKDSLVIYSWAHSNLPDGAYEWNISKAILRNASMLESGCYRMFYVLADSSLQAETHGHYDIAVQ